MNIPILRGHPFNASNGPETPRVTIVTQSLADRLWPNEDPLGKTLWDESNQLQVIGVVPDTAYTSTVERERPPSYYLPLEQNYEASVALHVGAVGNPMSLVPAIREAVRQVDSQIALERPQLLRSRWRQKDVVTPKGLYIFLSTAGKSQTGLVNPVANQVRSGSIDDPVPETFSSSHALMSRSAGSFFDFAISVTLFISVPSIAIRNRLFLIATSNLVSGICPAYSPIS